MAAKHYNTVVNNIDEWWLQKTVQDSVKKFNEKYALTSAKWYKSWVKELG